jgi:DNA-binding CsgD family transcriptional regulator
MNQRKRPKPLPGWNPPTEPVEVIEMMSDDEKAGKPLPPLVELRPGGPPVEIVEAYPNPLPAPPTERPFSRDHALAGLQAAFALLTDDELQVAQMRMLGAPFIDISEVLAIRQERVEKLWKQARRKLGTALFGGG